MGRKGSGNPPKQQDEFNQKIATRLKALREHLNLTPEKMAEKLGIHVTMLYKYEDNLHKIPASLLSKLYAKRRDDEDLFNLSKIRSSWLLGVRDIMDSDYIIAGDLIKSNEHILSLEKEAGTIEILTSRPPIISWTEKYIDHIIDSYNPPDEDTRKKLKECFNKRKKNIEKNLGNSSLRMKIIISESEIIKKVLKTNLSDDDKHEIMNSFENKIRDYRKSVQLFFTPVRLTIFNFGLEIIDNKHCIVTAEFSDKEITQGRSRSKQEENDFIHTYTFDFTKSHIVMAIRTLYDSILKSTYPELEWENKIEELRKKKKNQKSLHLPKIFHPDI